MSRCLSNTLWSKSCTRSITCSCIKRNSYNCYIATFHISKFWQSCKCTWSCKSWYNCSAYWLNCIFIFFLHLFNLTYNIWLKYNHNFPMKLNFYIILLLLLSFVVKADQILELIKIPNLTLHKLENKNSLAYLKPTKDFFVGSSFKNISCKK